MHVHLGPTSKRGHSRRFDLTFSLDIGICFPFLSFQQGAKAVFLVYPSFLPYYPSFSKERDKKIC